MDLVITISGLHGTGKSTYAKAIASSLNFRYISAGSFFRQIAEERGLTLLELSEKAELDDSIDDLIDKRTRIEAEKGSVILDGLLAGWIAREYADLKIFLKASNKVRICRIAKREEISYKLAEKKTLERESIERNRFMKKYGFDILDLSIYDYVLNTGLLSIDSNIEIVNKLIEEYISNKIC